MVRFFHLLTLAAIGSLLLAADDETKVVFKSDVALVRVDAQVLDRSNRAITGLRLEDFILTEDGQPRQIRSFASEDMPLDVLLLLDVSGSMRPHVERIADAAHEALRVLATGDRVAIMDFDTSARLRMPFRNSRDEVNREFERLLRQETFNGGTDITRALLQAADYVRREARRDARRAIVILTDDQTGFERDEAAVERALERADAVLSLLLAPDAMAYGRQRGGYPGGGGNPRGGGYPGGGYPGGGSGPLGGIILGRRGGYGGRQPGGTGYPQHQTKSAGTAEIARQSGGDTMSVDDASALEETLSRLRQRYALYFHLPENAKPGDERSISVDLSPAARRRYSDAEIRFRRVYLAPDGPAGSGRTMVTRAPDRVPAESSRTATLNNNDDRPVVRRRVAVDEPDGPRINMPGGPADQSVQPAQPAVQTAAPEATKREAPPAAKPDVTPGPKPGWRRVADPPPPDPPAKPPGQQ
jgi:VWFA-related protein